MCLMGVLVGNASAPAADGLFELEAASEAMLLPAIFACPAFGSLTAGPITIFTGLRLTDGKGGKRWRKPAL